MKHLLLLILFSCIFCQCKEPSDGRLDPVVYSQSITPYPKIKESPIELGLAGYAKVMCSAIYVSNRDPEEAFVNSGYFLLPDSVQSKVTYRIDEQDKSVWLSLGSDLVKRARYYGDQGCIICRDNKDSLSFIPERLVSSLPSPENIAWPMGDVLPEEYPNDVNPETIKKAIDMAFQPEEALTAAMVILYKGKIIGERYREGINKNTQLESWSMGKSLTATLIGRMIQQGYFSLDDASLFPEWSDENDPRSKISVKDLLQMSGGLKFSAHRDPDAEKNDEYLDHFYIYTGAVDAFDFSINRPLEFPVGREGRYRNCDPLALGLLMKRTIQNANLSYLQYPQKELFDKLGIRKQVLETDPFGNFLLTGYDYGTARNWARLGQLYLNDGVWMGERLLPEGFVPFVHTKGDGWKTPVYGGLFWLNGEGEFPFPSNTYYMAGAGGQRTIIVPDHDLVVVRMGHFRGSEKGMESLNAACSKILEALLKK
jgi:CubicO group peptidase (beta-lactamase class C family)